MSLNTWRGQNSVLSINGKWLPFEPPGYSLQFNSNLNLKIWIHNKAPYSSGTVIPNRAGTNCMICFIQVDKEGSLLLLKRMGSMRSLVQILHLNCSTACLNVYVLLDSRKHLSLEHMLSIHVSNSCSNWSPSVSYRATCYSVVVKPCLQTNIIMALNKK